MAREIGPFEFEILATLINQPGDAYGLTIRDRIKERSGHEPSVGMIYTAFGPPRTQGPRDLLVGRNQERGGRRKRLYKIEASGELAARRFGARFAAFGASAPAMGQVI